MLDDLVQFLDVENLQILLLCPDHPDFVEPVHGPADAFLRQAGETTQVEPGHAQVEAGVGVTEARVALGQNQHKRGDPGLGAERAQEPHLHVFARKLAAEQAIDELLQLSGLAAKVGKSPEREACA